MYLVSRLISIKILRQTDLSTGTISAERFFFLSMHWGRETSIKIPRVGIDFGRARDKISLHELIV